ncbi:MAG: hypothetical protein JWN71_1387 [Xanthobacteraceae bacterium]|jgi:hypothetical protein|nr:hypothetical protein [Xanthobacteraceae bacterium]
MNKLKVVLLATALSVGSAGLALAQVGVDGSAGTQSGAKAGTTGTSGSTNLNTKAGVKAGNTNADVGTNANAKANAKPSKAKGPGVDSTIGTTNNINVR